MSAELFEVLRAQGARWPAMTAQDILKLLYQHSFGAGHLIRNREEMTARLREEYLAARPVEGLPLFEPRGGGWARRRGNPGHGIRRGPVAEEASKRYTDKGKHQAEARRKER